jgi:parvulin-like peptidyl-prolyl isomerase
MDEDRRGAVLLYGLIGLVVVFAAALIGYGYYKDKIAPKHETVLTVANRSFDLRFLERRVSANLKAGLLQGNSTLEQAVTTSLQGIELEEMTRVLGRAQGIYPTDAEIDNQIRTQLGLPDGIDRNTFAAAYRQELLQIGLPVSEYREIIAAQVISTKLQQQYQDAVPDQIEQVDAQIIKTADEATAKEAKAKLDAGDKFNVTASGYSTDDSKTSGGELGWVAKAELSPKEGDALFSLPIGQISDPIMDRDGWYIVLARDKQVRDVDADHKHTIAQKTFDNAIQDARAKVGSTNRLTEDQIVQVGRDVLS